MHSTTQATVMASDMHGPCTMHCTTCMQMLMSLSVMNLDCMQIDLARCKYLQVLEQLSKDKGRAQKQDMVILTTPPASMYASKGIKASQFNCAPIVPLQFVIIAEAHPTALPTGHFVDIGTKKMQVFLAKPTLPTSKDLIEGAVRASTCAMYMFWWCRECKTTDEKICNLEMSFQEYKGATIPIICNHRDVGEHQQMYVLQQAKQQAQSSVAIAQQDTTVPTPHTSSRLTWIPPPPSLATMQAPPVSRPVTCNVSCIPIARPLPRSTEDKRAKVASPAPSGAKRQRK